MDFIDDTNVFYLPDCSSMDSTTTKSIRITYYSTLPIYHGLVRSLSDLSFTFEFSVLCTVSRYMVPWYIDSLKHMIQGDI